MKGQWRDAAALGLLSLGIGWLALDASAAGAPALVTGGLLALILRPTQRSMDAPDRQIGWLVASVSGLAVACFAVRSSGMAAAFYAGLGGIALWWGMGEPLHRRRLRHRAPSAGVIAAIASAVLVLLQFRGIWNAEFGIIDDHEILWFLGADRELTLTEMPAMLMRTEVAEPGTALRYRPSYYALRLAETWLWGDSPAAWYLARLGMLWVTTGTMWLILLRAFPPLFAVSLAIIMTEHSFWAELCCRLGPAETYAAFGTALFALGWLRPLAGVRCGWSWTLVAAGAVIAMGAKENLLILLPACWVLAWLSWRRQRGWGASAAIGVVSAYGMFIAGSVVVAISQVGADVYQRPRDAGAIGDLLPAAFAVVPLPWWQLAAIAGAVAAACWRRRRAGRPCVAAVAIGCALLAAPVIVRASQFLFYAGSWPTGMRYDFPGLLAVQAMWGMTLVLGRAGLQRLGVERGLLRGFQAGATAGCVVLAISWQYELYHNAGTRASVVKDTRAFHADLQSTVARLRAQPGRALVIEAAGPAAYEPVLSLNRFLLSHGVTNPLFLRYTAGGGRSALDEVLERRLSGLEREGSCAEAAMLGVTFRPLQELPTGSPFVTLVGCSTAVPAGELVGDGMGLGARRP